MDSQRRLLESIQTSLSDLPGEFTGLQWIRKLPGGDSTLPTRIQRLCSVGLGMNGIFYEEINDSNHQVSHWSMF